MVVFQIWQMSGIVCQMRKQTVCLLHSLAVSIANATVCAVEYIRSDLLRTNQLRYLT
jgi:hypothetical protein